MTVKKTSIFLICLLFCIQFIISCKKPVTPDEDAVATIEELQFVLDKDLILFSSSILPYQIYENLSKYSAIIVGEFHTILEEREFVASLTTKINDINDHTEICAECPDAYSWIFEKISIGELNQIPEGITYNKILPILDSLKIYNSNNNKLVKLKCIDANLQSKFFLNSLLAFVHYFADSTDLSALYDSLSNSSSSMYKEKLNYYIDLLMNSPNDLGLSSSSEYTTILLNMFENEMISVDIREKWDSDYKWSFNKRETLIKSNAEHHLSKSGGTIVFYFGLNHAQKKRFIGSNIEWLGEYLHNKSVSSSGKTISIVGVPLKGEITDANGQGTIYFDLVKQSQSNDLFRLVGERTKQKYSWLFLTDDLFFDKNICVKYIYNENEIIAPIGRQFDAFYFVPVGSYVDW